MARTLTERGPAGTVQITVYFGPSFTVGRSGRIGSGCWPTAAGKNPLSIVRWPIGELPKSLSAFPSILSVLWKPGPEILASLGSFAAAVAGTRRAPTATASINRFIASSFLSPHLHRGQG